MKSVAILQSNYIPWQGYFDLIRDVDAFVILDTVQFTKNDWRNRNQVRVGGRPAWLTIPVRTAGRSRQAIDEAETADASWARRHWRTIAQNYAGAPGFRPRAAELEDAYRCAAAETRLSAINQGFIELLCRWLGITTPILRSERFPDHPDRIERLIGMCRAAGATSYVSGPRGATYLDPERFGAAGIELRYYRYADYPEPRLSALDAVLAA